MSDWVHGSRQLVCEACGEVLGRASLWPDGTLAVGDRDERQVRPTTAHDALDAAQALARHFSLAAQDVATNHELREADRQQWKSDRESAESAAHASLLEVRRLQGDTDDATYYLVCRGGHRPRITATRLSREIRNAPGERLLLS